MKIGLIDPGYKKTLFNESFPYLGLGYIAAMLENHGHQVEILDVDLVGKKGTYHFLRNGFDLFGISATSFTISKALQIAEQIKAINGDNIIVLGGPHVSIMMESVLKPPHIDYAIYGEGEFTMLELTNLLEKATKPKPEDLSVIKGLIFRDGKQTIVNSKRPRIYNLDDLPFPAFHLFDMEKYTIYPILTSRGCPFGCAFCSIKPIWGTAWRCRSPENIAQEIDYALQKFKWGKRLFNIIDDSFNVDPERVMHFCKLILDRGVRIKWFAWGIRADRVSLNLALTMKEAGCIAVSVGIESANNEVLKKMGKKETLEEIIRGCQNLFQAGIPISATFMIGNIGDTFETVKESLKFARSQLFFNIFFYLALPYPKTELWDYVKEKGRFLYEDFTHFHHFSNEPIFETPEFLAVERAKAYALSRRLVIKTRIREEIKNKLSRIRRWDFEDLSLLRMGRAMERMVKYFLDFILKRDEQV